MRAATPQSEGPLYGRLYRLALGRIEPELAHTLAVHGLNAATLRGRIPVATPPPELAVEAFGLRFATPLGVAAGLDKDASWFAALGAIGFGSVEVGTVTPVGQPGNERPRIRRVRSERALVNRMGFPNLGASRVAPRLAGRRPGLIVGVNVGKNRDTPLAAAPADYARAAAALAPHADYVAVNVSSPNTPGLRALESVDALRAVLTVITVDRPLLVKISPDLADAEVEAVAGLAVELGLAGVIAVNTTVARPLSPAGLAELPGFSGGGLSGPPLRPRALEVLRRLAGVLRGSGVAIVSVGGVSDAADVWERVLAGASLVQAYTGFVYGGPGWPAQINRELAARVRRAGVRSIGELVGAGG
jgi:dihydroorotate dehydrogenase